MVILFAKVVVNVKVLLDIAEHNFTMLCTDNSA